MAKRAAARPARQPDDFLAVVGGLLNDLTSLGAEPTLVGGMALVTLGSPRVTRDFDFLVVEEAREQIAVVQAFYRHGFQLATRLDNRGAILRTIDDERVAAARLRIDRPRSACFYNATLGLRVDLLFDFPVPARGVHSRSTRKRIRSHPFHIASTADLIRMKEIAAADRRTAADRQDLEFLKSLSARTSQ
jgi:hypothetical protein